MQRVYVIAMVITSYIKQHIYHITATNPLRPAGIILCMHPANERLRYNVTSSLIGWAHEQDDPWAWTKRPTVCRPHFQMYRLEWILIEIFNKVYPSRSNSWQVSIGPGNGLVPWGNKLLPGPMLTKVYYAIWHYQATMGWIILERGLEAGNPFLVS